MCTTRSAISPVMDGIVGWQEARCCQECHFSPQSPNHLGDVIMPVCVWWWWWGISPNAVFLPFAAAGWEAANSDACQEDWPGDDQLPWQALELTASLAAAVNRGK